MNHTAKLKSYFTIPSNLYLTGLCFVGILVFMLNSQIQLPSTSGWVLLFSLTGSILLLNQVLFRLPPEGNAQSMDSALYLACIFTFGLQLSLNVLLISSVIYILYQRRIVWWKHIINFAVYALMIVSAHYVFVQTGGHTGPMEPTALYSYLLAMTAYFTVNVIALGIYFMLLIKKSLFQVIHGFVKETITAYISTLLLSLMLTMMFETHFYFGLFLFLIIAVLLSVSFKQLFRLYQEVSDKAARDPRTNLFNHGYFEELLEKELAQAKASGSPLSLVILDVDSFKKI